LKLKLAKSEHTEPKRCLKCGEINDAATGIVDKHARNTLKPKPGDIMICFYCGHVMRLNDKLAFRELTAGERQQLVSDQRFQMTKTAVGHVIKTRIKH